MTLNCINVRIGLVVILLIFATFVFSVDTSAATNLTALQRLILNLKGLSPQSQLKVIRIRRESADGKVHLCGNRLLKAIRKACQSQSSTYFSPQRVESTGTGETVERQTRGVSDDCCTVPCSESTLTRYCGNSRKSTTPMPVSITEQTTTTTTTATTACSLLSPSNETASTSLNNNVDPIFREELPNTTTRIPPFYIVRDPLETELFAVGFGTLDGINYKPVA